MVRSTSSLVALSTLMVANFSPVSTCSKAASLPSGADMRHPGELADRPGRVFEHSWPDGRRVDRGRLRRAWLDGLDRVADGGRGWQQAGAAGQP
jgi:hypothetical protein